ncbi:unnamed protein product, partial [Durusdinium trenchii]
VMVKESKSKRLKAKPERREKPAASRPLAPRPARRWTWSLGCLVLLQALAVLAVWPSTELPRPALPAREPHVAVPASSEAPAPPVTAVAAPGVDFGGETPGEGDIAALVIATGRNVQSLQKTLRSLLRAGFGTNAVLVSQSAPGEASRELCGDLGIAWAGPSPHLDVATFDGEADPWVHYGRSLDHAKKHFAERDFRSLFIAEEDLIFSNGLHSYLAQLHPLLFKDSSLWCISAYSDLSLAPFARDVSVMLRTSWFSGRAWMVSFKKIVEVILPHWSLQQRWRPLLRQLAAEAQQDCLVPEVSRAAFTGYLCDSAGIPGQCDEEEVESRRGAPLALLARGRCSLGEVQRLAKERYDELLRFEWPQAGALAQASTVATVEQLYQDASTPLLLVVNETKDVAECHSWSTSASEAPPTGARGTATMAWCACGGGIPCSTWPAVLPRF